MMVGQTLDEILRELQSLEWQVSLGVISNYRAFGRNLRKNKVVEQLRKLCESNENNVEFFRHLELELERLVATFEPGFQFPYTECLSAVAVAVEELGNSFAKEYISSLAKLGSEFFPANYIGESIKNGDL